MLLQLTLTASNWYVSPTGGDQNIGGHVDEPLATIGRAIEKAVAGDTIFLMPGTYPGRHAIQEKKGAIDQPIVIKSYSNNPEKFAVIDAEGTPSKNSKDRGFTLENCSWINFEQLVFKRCWPNVIQLVNSSYVTIRNCHFTSGRRIVMPTGHKAHHILVEHCYVKHPEEVWNGWSWEEIHHGAVEYYNGALLHPWRSGGGHVMRHNECIYLFNAFRTRPTNIAEDGNIEVYNNTLIDIRDNEYEPETWAWNMFYYHNRHRNIHKAHSIDGVKGGNIYIFGNTYTQTKDPWAIEEVSGIYKYSSYDDGSLTYPCYVFNNSFYTEANVLRRGESTNHQIKHFNNAYYFFDGVQNFKLAAWQPGFEFDYDCINQDWPPYIYEKEQEKHGLKNTNPAFINPESGDFQLQPSSPLIDKGKVLSIPALEWTQDYFGLATDIGAYEGNTLTDGPPYRFIPSPEGAFYSELPRISKHKVIGHQLILYFTEALQTDSITVADIQLFEAGKSVVIDGIQFPRSPYEMVIHTKQPTELEQLSLVFVRKPIGQNGLPFTRWASTITIGKKVAKQYDLAALPIELVDHGIPELIDTDLELSSSIHSALDSATIVLTSTHPIPKIWVDRLALYSIDGTEKGYYPKWINDLEYHFDIDLKKLPKGKYEGRLRVARKVMEMKLEF